MDIVIRYYKDMIIHPIYKSYVYYDQYVGIGSSFDVVEVPCGSIGDFVAAADGWLLAAGCWLLADRLMMFPTASKLR